MMKLVLKELIDLLIEQKSALSNMLELSQEERRIIISGETEKLENVVRLELRELSKLGAIEKKRTALHKSIATALDLPSNDITVSSIARRAKPDEREAIIKLQSELTNLIERHTSINEENSELIKAQLEYSEAMLELMVESEDPLNNFYGGDGKAAPARKRSISYFNSHA
jgi:flagellar biosynthesis/type III secretory pathway chaperone